MYLFECGLGVVGKLAGHEGNVLSPFADRVALVYLVATEVVVVPFADFAFEGTFGERFLQRVRHVFAADLHVLSQAGIIPIDLLERVRTLFVVELGSGEDVQVYIEDALTTAEAQRIIRVLAFEGEMHRWQVSAFADAFLTFSRGHFNREEGELVVVRASSM